MEEHPVPQNVTAFEFHLVGDMTLKQFGYLAAGLVIAYIIFAAAASRVPFVAYPLIAISALVGVAFAFLPIQERPLDHWVKAYFKAIFSPTVGKFSSKVISADEEKFNYRLGDYLARAYPDEIPIEYPIQIPPVSREASRAQPVKVTSQAAPSIPTQPIKANPPPEPPTRPSIQNAQGAKPAGGGIPQSQELSAMVEYAEEAQILQTQIVETERELESIKKRAGAGGSGAEQLAVEFQKVLAKLQLLNNQASQISAKLNSITKTPEKPQAAPKARPNVVKATFSPQQALISLTTVENIINGIVTDAAGNYLEGVIVVTHDKDGLPVRALKSNKLGQFLAATPLPNGTYTLSFEKDNLSFDQVQVDLNETVLPPIKISAKKGEI